ncbi:hypothetical protein chiPu_0008567 [Chiloscyllium punctatum]|uniref:Ig-like domain-containing protein n=1 Tax=Chiloscyllium punctatum TaxID=137246 RepID=A0A401SIE6_CHIPU|nr:hypothetical protein [Chiloscyllium punctatum]
MPGKNKRGKGKGRGRKGRRGEKVGEEPTAASAPKIKPLKSDVVVNEGKKLVLRCEAISGYPQPTFKWYKDGKELISNKKSKEIRIKRKKRKESELLIRKVKPSHAGEYMCEAINQQGEDRSISNIAVTPEVPFLKCEEQKDLRSNWKPLLVISKSTEFVLKHA